MHVSCNALDDLSPPLRSLLDASSPISRFVYQDAYDCPPASPPWCKPPTNVAPRTIACLARVVCSKWRSRGKVVTTYTWSTTRSSEDVADPRFTSRKSDHRSASTRRLVLLIRPALAPVVGRRHAVLLFGVTDCNSRQKQMVDAVTHSQDGGS
jgi:hypothetical protein